MLAPKPGERYTIDRKVIPDAGNFRGGNRMFCHNCGAALPEEGAFCPQCGQRVKQDTAPNPYTVQSAQASAPQEDKDFDVYVRSVNARLGTGTWVPQLNAWSYYDEEFRVKWGASKMKRFSFITYMDWVDGAVVQQFSAACTQFALNNYPGMARGMQVGVASFAVIASRNLQNSAVEQVMQTPPAHFAAFEMPVLLDLNTGSLYHMQKTPLWGALMWSDLRKYADQKFAPVWQTGPAYRADPPVVSSRPDGGGNCLFTCPSCGKEWQLPQGQGQVPVKCPGCGAEMQVMT